MRLSVIRWTERCLLYVMLLIAMTWIMAPASAAGDPQFTLYPDLATNLRVQMIGQRIALAAGYANPRFYVINDREFQALALPDGRVYATSMLASILSDDELAFVLGHEMTHVAEKHAGRRENRAAMGAIFGGILAAALGGDDHDIRMGAEIAGGLTYGQYSRADERRADAGGQRLMARCGYDPMGAANAMQRIIDIYGRGDAHVPVVGWFADHPDVKERKQHMLTQAKQLQQQPPAMLAPPFGVEIVIDSSAEHALPWVFDYLAYQLTMHGAGSVAVLPSPHSAILKPGRIAPVTSLAKGLPKDKVLPKVVITPVDVPPRYRVTVAMREVPAGRTRGQAGATGTAVETRLTWQDLQRDFTGECIAIAQTINKVPRTAKEQLARNPEGVSQLATTRRRNLEGTLEATATRRAAMAVAEVIEARAPVDHSGRVKFRMYDRTACPGDYVNVVRKGLVVAQIRICAIDGSDMTGEVLWGVHTWNQGDRFTLDSFE